MNPETLNLILAAIVAVVVFASFYAAEAVITFAATCFRIYVLRKQPRCDDKPRSVCY